MSEAWSEIERLADGIVEKSGESLTHAQAVSRVLKSEQGKALYARSRVDRGDTIAAIAEEELSYAASRLVRRGVAKEEAVAIAIERNPALAKASEGFAYVANNATPRALRESPIEKSDIDPWQRIEELAQGLVEKSDEPLTEHAAIDRVLKTDEGKQLYRRYADQRAV